MIPRKFTQQQPPKNTKCVMLPATMQLSYKPNKNESHLFPTCVKKRDLHFSNFSVLRSSKEDRVFPHSTLRFRSRGARSHGAPGEEAAARRRHGLRQGPAGLLSGDGWGVGVGGFREVVGLGGWWLLVGGWWLHVSKQILLPGSDLKIPTNYGAGLPLSFNQGVHTCCSWKVGADQNISS